jgi:hypothetical protein
MRSPCLVVLGADSQQTLDVVSPTFATHMTITARQTTTAGHCSN